MTDEPPAPRSWCPGCEPELDPTQELVQENRCGSHQPTRDGADDTLAGQGVYLSGSADVDGLDNARWCALIHRGSTMVDGQSSEKD